MQAIISCINLQRSMPLQNCRASRSPARASPRADAEGAGAGVRPARGGLSQPESHAGAARPAPATVLTSLQAEGTVCGKLLVLLGHSTVFCLCWDWDCGRHKLKLFLHFPTMLQRSPFGPWQLSTRFARAGAGAESAPTPAGFHGPLALRPFSRRAMHGGQSRVDE